MMVRVKVICDEKNQDAASHQPLTTIYSFALASIEFQVKLLSKIE